MLRVLSPRIFLLTTFLFLIPLHLHAECGDRVCDTGEDTYNCAYDCGLVVDHHAVLQFDEIPEEWITKAKEFTIHYAHSSHGEQINEGLLWLEGENPKYSFAIRRDNSTADLPTAENPPEIRMFSGNPPYDNTGIIPSTYYREEGGRTATLNVAKTGNFDFSMFSFCRQMCYFDQAAIDEYNGIMNDFENNTELDNLGIKMRFIYMTGTYSPGDVNCPAGSLNTVNNNNQWIRDYAIANHKILFDYRDIETHSPDGTEYPSSADECSWCTSWCDANPSYCSSLPEKCDHSDDTDAMKLSCALKAKAFWWMMARLAGWGGGEGDDGGPNINDSNNHSGATGGCSVSSYIYSNEKYSFLALILMSIMMLILLKAIRRSKDR